MKILVINGDCIQRNSSANLCHIAYIQGLVDAGHDVTLLSADGKGYTLDSSLHIPEQVTHYTYNGLSLYEKLSLKRRAVTSSSSYQTNSAVRQSQHKKSLKNNLIKGTKKMILSCYGVHGVYTKFVRKAQKFKSNDDFDYVLSISTPVTSHLIAYNLLSANHIHTKHWIQIWEDPWYSDAYGFNGAKRIYKEEKRLLSFAELICYVSPLTLKNQQRIYPESAEKMYWQPLPYYYRDLIIPQSNHRKNVYGYFGDYMPVARDLRPFYEAANDAMVEVNICGNPSHLFQPTDLIHIYPRMPLSELKTIEDQTNVLIFLCNRKGGQIPGKIYQYSATNKTILFILDGTQEEKDELYNYFSNFNRYVFCENTKEDIMRALLNIENNRLEGIENKSLEEYFSPVVIVENILKGKS